MFGQSTSRDPYRGPALVTQGLRPHWLRLVLLLVAVFLFMPSLAAWPAQIASESAPPIVGSAQPLPAVQAEIQAAISRANTAFRDARARADLAPLEGVATGDWLDYERGQIANLRASGTTERWTPRSIQLSDPVVRGATATVCSDERWERLIVKAGAPTGSAEPFHSVEQYRLVREAKGWLISAIDYDTRQCQG